MERLAVIGIDLGGTNVKLAEVDRGGRIRARRAFRFDVTRSPSEVIAELAAHARALLSDGERSVSDLCAVGIGLPGPLNLREGTIVRAANLPGWEGVEVRELLRADLGCPLVLDNDGNAAAFGEYWAGGAYAARDLVMLTLGTGVGAGVVLDGNVLHGHFDNAAELGHAIVVPNGIQCPCGQRGCLEQYASAASVARRVVKAVEAGESCALAQVIANGESVGADDVVRHARQGDRLCLRIWDEACLYLAIACINIQHAYNPARILLGGGMSKAGEFLVDKVRSFIDQHRWSLHDDLPEVGLAKLGYDAGVIGAAGLAWQAVAQDIE